MQNYLFHQKFKFSVRICIIAVGPPFCHHRKIHSDSSANREMWQFFRKEKSMTIAKGLQKQCALFIMKMGMNNKTHEATATL